MKLAFFLAAFFLIFLRVYFKSLWPGSGDRNSVTITISSDDDFEKIRYSGKIVLTDDETGVVSIAPGGYIRFRKNEVRLEAESDLQGNIRYELSEGDQQLSPDGQGKKIIAQALGEMIAYGFEGRDRMLRIYQRGGDTALLHAMDHFKSPGMQEMYLKFLVEQASLKNLTEEDWNSLLNALGRMFSEPDRKRLLLHLAPIMPKTPMLRATYERIAHAMINKEDGEATLKAIQ